MRVTYHGHSCFEIEHNDYRLLIDPFITGNPLAKVKPEDLKPDYILLTHGHNDHVGDTVPIAKASGATVIAPHELAVWLGWQGLKTHGMATGGTFRFDFGTVKVINALHGSGLVLEDKKEIIYTGPASGFVLMLGDKTIYHAGDTALFSDMKLIGMHKPIDLALLPIGGNFTMDPEDALVAAEWIGAKQVIPMHYNTFPPIQQDGDAFVKNLEQKGIKGFALKAGEALEL
ncbi:MAG: metal-dependent hydrolase [Thermoactinomyces sp.]|jgi:L-ascorbate metabolism protein UlaG (beta-lactamase superfamily)